MLSPILRPHLDIIFVGFNPHPFSWDKGKYYAHGSLWRIIRKAGLGAITDDSQLFDYNYGITDIVHDKPTREAHEITDAEYAAGVVRLKKELKRLRPRVVCFTGKGAYKFFAGLNSTKGIEYGAVGRYENINLFVVPFPSHKWMTDAAKVEHYKVLCDSLPAAHPSRTEKLLVAAPAETVE